MLKWNIKHNKSLERGSEMIDTEIYNKEMRVRQTSKGNVKNIWFPSISLEECKIIHIVEFKTSTLSVNMFTYLIFFMSAFL